jgi:hypothetical protein
MQNRICPTFSASCGKNGIFHLEVLQKFTCAGTQQISQAGMPYRCQPDPLQPDRIAAGDGKLADGHG